MDCDDVMLALANRDRRTLTDAEQRAFHLHLEDCEECRALAVDTTTDWRWIARLPEDAFEDPTALVLPTVDPVVFDIDMEIAAGGMGRITKATDRRLGRDVALKEVLEPNMRARFEREALITARLQHPAIVPIYEAGTFPNGSAFYTMRLVWGGTLGAAIHKTKTMAERLALLPHVLAVIDALAYAHNNQIIHRDLKPGNVLIGEFGETVVIDWGLAKELGTSDGGDPGAPSRPSGASLTRVGAVLGTPGFMSPEQASGGTIDERADVYALGALLYNLLAGVPPYYDKHEKDGSTQIIAIGLTKPPTPIGEIAPDAPADLRMICEKAMARVKEDRYRSAAEMAKELRNFQAGRLIAREYSTRELITRWIRKHRTPVAIGSVAALALAVVAVVAFYNVSHSKTEAQDQARVTELLADEAGRENKKTKTSFAALLEEQGLRELAGGDSNRALTYLAAAAARGRDSTALRYLIASASHDLDLRQHDFPTGSAIAFTRSGELVTIERTRMTIRKGDTLVREHLLGAADIKGAWFDDDARHVAIHRGELLEVWDVEAGTKWEMPVVMTQPGVAFGGSRVAVFGDDQIAIRNVAGGAVVGDLPLANIAEEVVVNDTAVAACVDGELRIWTKLDAAPRTRPNARCTKLAFLEPGVLAVATSKFELLRWPIDRETPAATMSGHIAINTLAIDRKGQRIATGDATGVVLWKWNGAALGESRDVQGGITKLAFSPDGTFMVGAGDDDKLLIWDTASFHLRQVITPDHGAIAGIAIDGDSKRIASVGSEGSHVWSVPSGRLVVQVASARVQLAGDQWVANEAHGFIVRRLDTGAEFRSLAYPGDGIRHSAAGDGRLTMLSNDYALQSYDLLTGEAGPVTQLDSDVKYTSNPHFVRVSEDRAVILIDARSGKRHRVATDAAPQAVDVARDGNLIAIATATALRVYRVDSGQLVSTVDRLAPGHRYLPHFDPAGRLVVTSPDQPTVVADSATGAITAELADARSPTGMTFSRDGARLALRIGNTVQVWDVAAPRKLYTVTSTFKQAYALSDDGTLLATGSVDGSIRIWDDTGRLLDRLVGSQTGVESLQFGAGDTRLIGFSQDNRASLWDVHVDKRTADEIVAFAAAHSDWKLSGVLLAPAR